MWTIILLYVRSYTAWHKAGEYDLKGLLADDGRWAQYASGKLLPIDQAPILIDDDIQNMGDKLVPVVTILCISS